MKSEPNNYSILDLKKDKRTWWTGVRNYQARNYMTQSMKAGDLAYFYHSNAEPSGIVGLMKIVSPKAKADETAFDKKSPYYEPKATLDKPIWECVEVEFVKEFKEILSLAQIRANKKLKDMVLLQKGSRLSIMPLTESEFFEIQKMIF